MPNFIASRKENYTATDRRDYWNFIKNYVDQNDHLINNFSEGLSTGPYMPYSNYDASNFDARNAVKDYYLTKKSERDKKFSLINEGLFENTNYNTAKLQFETIYKDRYGISKWEADTKLPEFDLNKAAGFGEPNFATNLLKQQRQEKEQQAQETKMSNMSMWSNIAGGVADVGKMAFANNSKVAGLSSTTQTLNTAYDTTSDGLMLSGNPYAMMAGAIMKAAGLGADALTAAGVGTDQMTGIDKVMDSKWLKLTPEGLLNASLAKSTVKFEKDAELQAAQGDAYADTYGDITAAANHAGKKYGLFSSSSRRKWNNKIQEQRLRQDMINTVNTENQDAIAAGNYEGVSIGNQNRLNGGVGMLRAGRLGMVLNPFKWAKRTVRALSGIKLNTFTPVGPTNKKLVGFSSTEIPEVLDTLDTDKSTNVNVTGNTGEKKEEKEEPNILVKGDFDPTHNMSHRFSLAAHLLSYDNDTYKTDGSWDVQKILEDISKNYPNIYNYINLSKSKEQTPELFLKHLYNEMQAVGNTRLEDGGIRITHPQDPSRPEYKKQGGTFNVIPDGALHKNKHNMEDAEGLTKKGIPVVTEEEGKLVQLAEIEKNEIIFRLEVTKKLEELAKKGTDEAAIEAGKLLVKEILHNTEDNTGLIDEVN